MSNTTVSDNKMLNDTVCSSAADGISPNSGIKITMENGSGNSEEMLDCDEEEGFDINANELVDEDNQILDVKSNDLEKAIQQVLGIDLEKDSELGIDCVDLEDDGVNVLVFENSGEQLLEIAENDNENVVTDSQNDDSQGKSYLPPIVGMEFESFDDGYSYYNCYAREIGFGIRVKSSWTKRNSKEKRGAVLCCNCEGFKMMKEASTRRKETRTGCLAMIRLRLVESKQWRLDEVKLEHNHIFDHERAQSSRSHKKMEKGVKRKLDSSVEVQTIKLYRTPAVDVVSCVNERELNEDVQLSKRLKFGRNDLTDLLNYFCEAQLVDANFYYITDFNDDGFVRNVFWIDSRSRGMYRHFGDVVVVDTSCISNKHDFPLLVFSGLNHHCESLLLGCGLICDEALETYVWLMRAWLTCMSGRAPRTIVTDQCKKLQSAIYEVFPRAHHRFCLPLIMGRICEKLGEVGESEVFQTILNRTVNGSLKVEEFETSWEEMIRHFGIRNNIFLQSLYEDRERWAPAYSKDTMFSGLYNFSPMNSFIYGYLHEKMSLNEFFVMYESLQQKRIEKEALGDLESREFKPVLRTSCNYELQPSEFYTKEIFLKFQEEVVQMSSSCSVTQIHTNGSIITYMIKERDSERESILSSNFEVVFDRVGLDIRCICNCFNVRGYLCRHALSVLNYNSIEEIPSQYVLMRWRKDLKRSYAIDPGSNNIDISNPVQWSDHLYRRAMQVVGEGMVSPDHHMAAWQAFKESLNKVRLLEKPL